MTPTVLHAKLLKPHLYKDTLQNGLTVLVKEVPGSRVATVQDLDVLSCTPWLSVLLSDASLDATDNREITAFLVKNASNRWSAPTAPLRISEAAWFKRKHNDHEINPAVWKNPKVKSPANCGACHPQAERGDFSERNIRIPG